MNTLNPIRYSLLLVALIISAPALSAGDAAAGKAKSATCAACHGEGGAKPIMPIYPILAGQHADYLAKAINDYKTGARKDPVMAGMAATLNDQDIADLTAFFASQKGLTVPPIK
jgi:cytochrome c553